MTLATAIHPIFYATTHPLLSYATKCVRLHASMITASHWTVTLRYTSCIKHHTLYILVMHVQVSRSDRIYNLPQNSVLPMCRTMPLISLRYLDCAQYFIHLLISPSHSFSSLSSFLLLLFICTGRLHSTAPSSWQRKKSHRSGPTRQWRRLYGHRKGTRT